MKDREQFKKYVEEAKENARLAAIQTAKMKEQVQAHKIFLKNILAWHQQPMWKTWFGLNRYPR